MGDWRSDAKPPVPDIDVEGIRMANEDYDAAADWQKRATIAEAELGRLRDLLELRRQQVRRDLRRQVCHALVLHDAENHQMVCQVCAGTGLGGASVIHDHDAALTQIREDNAPEPVGEVTGYMHPFTGRFVGGVDVTAPETSTDATENIGRCAGCQILIHSYDRVVAYTEGTFCTRACADAHLPSTPGEG